MALKDMGPEVKARLDGRDLQLFEALYERLMTKGEACAELGISDAEFKTAHEQLMTRLKSGGG